MVWQFSTTHEGSFLFLEIEKYELAPTKDILTKTAFPSPAVHVIRSSHCWVDARVIGLEVLYV